MSDLLSKEIFGTAMAEFVKAWKEVAEARVVSDWLDHSEDSRYITHDRRTEIRRKVNEDEDRSMGLVLRLLGGPEAIIKKYGV